MPPVEKAPTPISKTSQLTFSLVIEISIGIIVVLGSLFAFLQIARNVLGTEVFVFDLAIMQFFYDARTPFVTEIMKGVTHVGGDIVLSSLTIITIIVLLKKNYKKDALLFGFILVFGVLLNLFLKELFGRPRPDLDPLVFEKSLSFPSGHAMNSTVFYISLSYFIFRNTLKKRVAYLLLFSLILIFAIGVSRIYLGAHYPSDVIAGFAAGLLWFAFVILFEKTITFIDIFRKNK